MDLNADATNKRRTAELARRISERTLIPNDRALILQWAQELEADAARLESNDTPLDA